MENLNGIAFQIVISYSITRACQLWYHPKVSSFGWSLQRNSSVTRRKSPNVYKSSQKIISLEKWKILKPLQKLPKNVGDLGELIVAKGFKKLPKVQKIAKSGHTGRNLDYHTRICDGEPVLRIHRERL